MTNDKPIGVGIVGAGFARSTQIPGFRNCEGARVVAINSRRRERAEQVAQEFGIEHVAGHWKELVARDDVDLVSVVTPPATHMEITLAALEQGCALPNRRLQKVQPAPPLFRWLNQGNCKTSWKFMAAAER